MTKISVEQALQKAKTHIKNGETYEAKQLYKTVLLTFPRNKRAQLGLDSLKKIQKNNFDDSPAQSIIQELVNLYNQRQLSATVALATNLIKQYPNVYILWNILGAANQALGRAGEATAAFKKVTELNPTYSEGFNNLGASFQAQGELKQAIEAYSEALFLDPNYIEAYNNKGSALKEQGNFAEAITVYQQANSIKPESAETYFGLGNIFQEQRRFEEAVVFFGKALRFNPKYAEAYNNMGHALHSLGKLEDAIGSFNKALLIKPNHAIAHNNLGNALHGLGKLDEAISAYNKALFHKANYPEAYHNLGKSLKNQGKLDEAISAFGKALSLKPDNAEVLNSLGVALKEQGKLNEPIEAYKKALSIKPDYLDAYYNLGIALSEQGKFTAAINTYNAALSIKPDYVKAHEGLSFAFLNIGRLEEGLNEYEWRWKNSTNLSRKRQFSQPLWDGQKRLKGKTILLWCEQGVGDTIRWSSCLSLISSLAQKCILECPQKLVPLLTRSFPNIEIRPEDRSQDRLRNEFDFHLPMGSLYRHFIPEISENIKHKAFLIPNTVRVNFWKEKLKSLGHGPYIGVSWRSSKLSLKRIPNYAPISDWLPVFKSTEATFVNLQYTDFVDDLTKIQSECGVKVHNFDDLDHFNDLDDVASLCAALDMVISTRITVPIISAGVGTITKLASWRQSPWNNLLLNPVGPSVEIYERDTWAPWNNLFQTIAEDLARI